MSDVERIVSLKIASEFDLLVSENPQAFEGIRELLTEKINSLLNKDLEKLFQILYRIDVSEDKARAAVAEKNASEILADLIIERQIQKAKTRLEFRKKNEETDDYNVGE